MATICSRNGECVSGDEEMSADECDDGVSEEHTGSDESDFGIVLSRGDDSPMLSGESTLSHIIIRAHGRKSRHPTRLGEIARCGVGICVKARSPPRYEWLLAGWRRPTGWHRR